MVSVWFLYGFNASGKSNILIALNEVFRLLVLSKSDVTQRINGSIPFMHTKDEPTEMCVSFYANGIRYGYDVRFNDKYIFNEALYYSEKLQLVITSQETTLLSQDLINENRGVVWFVEKSKEIAFSVYSRGNSFGLHKNIYLYNSYRIRHMGAKPELSSIFINLKS